MIDGMTLTEAGEIFRYWEDNPPPHLLLQAIARLLGWQPGRQPAPASIAELAASPPPGLAVAPAATLDTPPVTFDLATLRARNLARSQPREGPSPLSGVALSKSGVPKKSR